MTFSAVPVVDMNDPRAFQYQYSYNQAGRMTAQRFGDAERTFDTGYTWDNEGRMTQVTYPGGGPVYQMTFDAMGRVGGMTENGSSVASATYGVAGELAGLSYFGHSESRTYNSMFQMTRQTVSGMMDMEYVYTAGANNGRIGSSVDHVLNETVNYTYDALNRLTLAETAGSGGWGQGFGYDGFGNLTEKTATKGSVPVLSVSFDGTTNRLVGGGYDANGNGLGFGVVFDVENRMVGQTLNGLGTRWVYDPSGKRVFQQNVYAQMEYYVYGVGGQKLMTTRCVPHTYHQGEPDEYTVMECTNAYNVYFGGKLVKSKGVVVATDRLGSVRGNGNGESFAYYPYGEERGTSADGREKFGTYTRDAVGQDYADQTILRSWLWPLYVARSIYGEWGGGSTCQLE